MKRYHPVQYGDQEGTLIISPTELAFVVSEDSSNDPAAQPKETNISSWPCSSIQRHMIKSTTDNKHFVRLIFDDAETDQKPVVIFEAATREMVEQIKTEISGVRRSISASLTLGSTSSSSAPKRTASEPGLNTLATTKKSPNNKKKRHPSSRKRRASLSPARSTGSGFSFNQDLPSHWTGSPPFHEKLVPISPKKKEYWHVLKTLRETMDGPCHLSRLCRIQNEGLWSYYQFRKEQLAKKYRTRHGSLNNNNSHSSQNNVRVGHEDYLNERTVWHGTSNLDPAVIYEDEQDGFMMQYSQTGFWGRGIYFSERSGYSDHYSYKPDHGAAAASGDRELLLVQLLIGQSIVLDREEPWQQEACQQLVAPPENPDFANNLKYDTVSGIVTDDSSADGKSTKIHVVYENGRGYPAYLVRYYKGDRDPTKTPYNSYEDAKLGKKDPSPEATTKTTANNDNSHHSRNSHHSSNSNRRSVSPKRPPRKTNQRNSSNNNLLSQSSTSSMNERDGTAGVDEEQGILRVDQKPPGDPQEQQQQIKSKHGKGDTTTSQAPEPGALAIQGINSASSARLNINNDHGNRNINQDILVKAAIVEENDEEVVVAEHMPHIWTSARGRKVIIVGLILCILMIIVLIVVTLLVFALPKDGKNNDETTTTLSNNNNSTTIIIEGGGGASNMLLNMFKNNFVLRSTINNLGNPDSPQFKAQEWLLADPKLDQYKQHRRARRFILATFFYATNGENWFNNTNWLDYNVDECDWYFNQNPCKPNGRTFFRIRLAWNNLQGTLIPELGVFRDLEVVSLVGGMHGRIPQPLFNNPSLTELVLKRTRMRGPIPSTIQKATSLAYLEISSNSKFDGELPTELGDLSNLQSLLVFNNSIAGPVPSEIGKLQSLTRLDLSNNMIEGQVPSELGSLVQLQALNLSSNVGLVGTLPTDLAAMTDLQQVDLSSTGLSGEIPWCSDQVSTTELEGTDLFYADGSC